MSCKGRTTQVRMIQNDHVPIYCCPVLCSYFPRPTSPVLTIGLSRPLAQSKIVLPYLDVWLLEMVRLAFHTFINKVPANKRELHLLNHLCLPSKEKITCVMKANKIIVMVKLVVFG